MTPLTIQCTFYLNSNVKPTCQLYKLYDCILSMIYFISVHVKLTRLINLDFCVEFLLRIFNEEFYHCNIKADSTY